MLYGIRTAVGGKGDADSHAGILAGKGVAGNQLTGSVEPFYYIAVSIQYLAVVVDLDAGDGTEVAQGHLLKIERCRLDDRRLVRRENVLVCRDGFSRGSGSIVGVDGILKSLGVNAVISGQFLNGVILFQIALIRLFLDHISIIIAGDRKSDV